MPSGDNQYYEELPTRDPGYETFFDEAKDCNFTAAVLHTERKVISSLRLDPDHDPATDLRGHDLYMARYYQQWASRLQVRRAERGGKSDALMQDAITKSLDGERVVIARADGTFQEVRDITPKEDADGHTTR